MLTPSQVATRTTAFVAFVFWMVSWLAPAIAEKAPKGSVFDLTFGPVARSRRRIAALVLAAFAAHFACVCFETGFFFNGFVVNSISDVWRIPRGDSRTYAIIVGIPCAALVALAFTSVVTIAFDPASVNSSIVRTAWRIVSAPSWILVSFVFLNNYPGQLVLRSLSFAGGLDFIGLSFYGLVTFVFFESLVLFVKFKRTPIPTATEAAIVPIPEPTEVEPGHGKSD